MGFKRPLVQIQSLGPNKQGYRKVPLFVCLGDLDRTPAASCNTIKGREAAKRRPTPRRPLVQIQSLGPNKQGYRKVPLFVCLGCPAREPAASCNLIRRRRPTRREAAGWPLVQIQSLGPNSGLPLWGDPEYFYVKALNRRPPALPSTAAGQIQSDGPKSGHNPEVGCPESRNLSRGEKRLLFSG